MDCIMCAFKTITKPEMCLSSLCSLMCLTFFSQSGSSIQNLMMVKRFYKINAIFVNNFGWNRE